MAETAGQVETEIDEKEQEEKEHVSRCQRIRKLFSFKNFGKALRYFIIFVWAMHINIFWCCLICVAAITVLSEGVDDTNDIWFIPTFIWFPLGTAVTPSVVVFLINSVGEYWSEIQSWQIFYIVWGAGCSFVWFVALMMASCGIENSEDLQNELTVWLLYPFGIKPKYTGDSILWSVPLVSVAPALVSGFLANYFMEEKFVLECHKVKPNEIVLDPYSCFDDASICCSAISSHTAPVTFLASLASTILAAWGVVKVVGYFICVHDDSVEQETEADKNKKMLKDLLSSKSGRDLMKESMALSEKEKSNHNTVTSAENNV